VAEQELRLLETSQKIADHGESAAGHLGEEDCRATPGIDSSLDFSQLQTRIDRLIEFDQSAVPS
jgi:hypothetical protein